PFLHPSHVFPPRRPFLLCYLPSPPGSPLIPYTTLFRSFLRRWTYQGNAMFSCFCQQDSQINVDRGWLEDTCKNVIALPFSKLQFALSWITPRNDVVVQDRKSTRLNSSHVSISYAVFCLKKK